MATKKTQRAQRYYKRLRTKGLPHWRAEYRSFQAYLRRLEKWKVRSAKKVKDGRNAESLRLSRERFKAKYGVGRNSHEGKLRRLM